jgi:hypothetical protein
LCIFLIRASELHFSCFAFLALSANESAVAVNPDRRLVALRDRLYKAVKSTPYANRRVVIQAVSYTEVAHWCKVFLKVTPSKSIKLPKRTKEAVEKLSSNFRERIPDAVQTFYHGKLSIWGATALKLETFLQFAYSHVLGRFNCKRIRGGDIALVYEIEVHWRSRYTKVNNRVRTAAVFTFSHCNLNKTTDGYTVRLPQFHGLTIEREASLRAIVLRYSNLFDHVVGIEEFDFDEEPDEEEACEDPASLEARAQAIIQGSGNWQDEL